MKVKPNAVLIVVALLTYWFGPFNASAFYDPGMQRWLNRDPIGYLGGGNLYLFSMNQPIAVHDIFGLSPDDCKDPCGDAKKQNKDISVSTGTHSSGGVICCGGKKYACAWDSTENGNVTNPTAQDIDKKCVEEHEKSHFDDVNCDPNCPGASRPPWKDPKRINPGECAAYKISVDCYSKSISDCHGNPDCINQIIFMRNYAQSQADKYCKSAGVK